MTKEMLKSRVISLQAMDFQHDIILYAGCSYIIYGKEIPKTRTALRKQLVEALVLSKLDFNDVVMYPLPQYLKLQRVQRFAASFVNNRYTKMADVIGLGWLPVKERTEFHLFRITHRI